jgi:phosphoglycolate phosphatase-like HAD superfamily hydrolase
MQQVRLRDVRQSVERRIRRSTQALEILSARAPLARPAPGPTRHPAVSAHPFATIDSHEREAIAAGGGRVYEGVIDGLRRLATRYSLLLVSNCQDWYLECFWKHVSVQRYFCGWDCHGSAGAPKASMIRALVDRFGAPESIYVGGTEGDRYAAEAAGVGFCHVSYGFGAVTGATLSFASFPDLVAHFADGERQVEIVVDQ